MDMKIGDFGFGCWRCCKCSLLKSLADWCRESLNEGEMTLERDGEWGTWYDDDNEVWW